MKLKKCGYERVEILYVDMNNLIISICRMNIKKKIKPGGDILLFLEKEGIVLYPDRLKTKNYGTQHQRRRKNVQCRHKGIV